MPWVENFRLLVKDLDPDDKHYLGLTSYHTQAAFNLGCGYAISRGALDAVAPRLPSAPHWAGKAETGCSDSPTWAEDSRFGDCMRAAGIRPGNTRDALGRETFLVFTVNDHLEMVRRPDSSGWFWSLKPKFVRHGIECCSSRPVLWHGFKFKSGRLFEMYYMYYMLYGLEVAPVAPVAGPSRPPLLR